MPVLDFLIFLTRGSSTGTAILGILSGIGALGMVTGYWSLSPLFLPMACLAALCMTVLVALLRTSNRKQP